MRIVRFEKEGHIHWGEIDQQLVHVLTGFMGEKTAVGFDLTEIQLLAPATPSKIVCVGRNYADHIKEMGNMGPGGDLPKEPGLFLKAPNTLANPEQTVLYPSWTENLHFEGELGLVIARRAQNVKKENALDYVYGYTCALDLTARDRQKSDLQWFRAKGADHFCPLGPWIETELDPFHLQVMTRVNGETRQNGNTENMIFDIPTVLEYVTQFMTLEAGDVVITGTPDGVGPLNRGDRVEVEVEGIGVLVTHIG
ncbi:fumarylacetoacetate hydrolase family protein [Deinococcus misasensis]|uniref:fumarylacetoacetate hydrolase family protein n=1 Tax=Deinococcus misasensis TaxID=392413 RepID=UPI0005525EBC|nr:fumarylacetoacetate hydrolase family protein [Deinococcus misasensis]